MHFVAMMDRALTQAWRWGEREPDEVFLSAIESSRRYAEEQKSVCGYRDVCRDTARRRLTVPRVLRGGRIVVWGGGGFLR